MTTGVYLSVEVGKSTSAQNCPINVPAAKTIAQQITNLSLLEGDASPPYLPGVLYLIGLALLYVKVFLLAPAWHIVRYYLHGMYPGLKKHHFIISRNSFLL